MRLKNMYLIAKEARQKLNIVEEILSSTAISNYQWEKITEGLNMAFFLDLVRKDSYEALNISAVAFNSGEYWQIAPKSHDKFCRIVVSIVQKLDVLINLGDGIGYSSETNAIDVNFPLLSDFNEFVSNMQDFQKFLKLCPFTSSEDVETKMQSFDVGSAWVEFIFIAANVTGVLIGLGKLTQEAVKIRSMKLTCEQQVEAIRAHKNKNDLAEKTIQVYDEMIKIELEASAQKLLGEDADPERLAKTEKSIEMLSDLMRRGIEIYSSLDAPAEIKDVFPSQTGQGLLVAAKKQITGGTDSEPSKSDIKE